LPRPNSNHRDTEIPDLGVSVSLWLLSVMMVVVIAAMGK